MVQFESKATHCFVPTAMSILFCFGLFAKLSSIDRASIPPAFNADTSASAAFLVRWSDLGSTEAVTPATPTTNIDPLGGLMYVQPARFNALNIRLAMAIGSLSCQYTTKSNSCPGN